MKKRIFSTLFAFILCFTVLLSACSAPPKANTGNETIDSMEIQQLAEALVRALNERTALIAQTENDAAEIVKLKELVQGIQFTNPEFPAITNVEDDTGRATFNKPGSYILLPDTLAYPGVGVVAVDNKLKMGGENGITLGLTPVWTFRLEGNKLCLSSTTGIYGEIALGKVNGDADLSMINTIFDGHPGQEEERDDWDRILQVYIPQSEGIKNTIPADPGKDAGKDGIISWSSRTVGRQVSLNTSVNGNSAVIRVGAFAVQNNAVVYTFVYETAYNDANEEIILALLTSISVQNKNITLEF